VLGTEFEAIPEEMRHEARLLMRDIYDWLIETLELGRAQGTLHFPGDARHKAVELGAALQGGLQISRMAGPEQFHQVIEQLALELTAATANPLP
jgi:TetR/AcrR family transcriptional repressor of nem operon